jgi:hypothetical protein
MDEVRRVGKDNGDELIAHFVAKAETQIEYIVQQKDMWSDFLTFFGEYDGTQTFEPDDEYDLFDDGITEDGLPLQKKESIYDQGATMQINTFDKQPTMVQLYDENGNVNKSF